MKNVRAGALLPVVCVLSVLTLSARADNLRYYISPTGSDSGGVGTSNNPWASFTRAYSAMVGGDTLIVKNGTYTNQTVISRWDGQRPPSGNASQYTTVQAETDGGVVVDGQGTSSPISMNGYPSSPVNYITIRGIVFRHQAGGAGLFNVNHMKFIRDGFEDAADGNSAVFSISGRNPNDLNLLESQYILIEECYAWGSGRYKFLVYHVGHTIFRRTVARFDRANTPEHDPMAVFSFYHSDTIECQNCISIDGDNIQFLVNGNEYSGSFYIPSTDGPSTDINIAGSIALNVDMQFGGITKNVDNVRIADSVGWHIREGVWARDSAAYDHVTFGDLYGPGIATVNDGSGVGLRFYPGDDPVNATAIRNSILHDIKGAALNGWSAEDYNVFSGNNADRIGGTPVGAHSTNANPNLTYIVRVESNNATLKGKASDGGDIGANIVKRIGVSGTLWGEEGYNTVTSEDLWPFPYEDVIRRDMRSYSYTGPTATAPYGGPTGPVQTLSGARGFCADGKQLNGKDDITLTSYIWEYLGHPIPPEIYGGTRAPVVFFSDLIDGPRTGWNGSATQGAAVTVWGNHFGSNRGSNYVTVAGVRLTNDSDYAEWGATAGNARGLERITFWLNSSMATGAAAISVTVGGLVSCTLPFYVRDAGTIYFVDHNNGNDAYDGLQDASAGGTAGPKRTLPNVRQLLSGGDLLYIRNGTYTETDSYNGRLTLDASRSGSVNHYTVYAGYPAETPLLDDTGDPNRGGVVRNVYDHVGHVVISKLRMTTTGSTGVRIQQTSVGYVRVIGTEHDAGTNGGTGMSGQISMFDMSHIKVFGCICRDLGEPDVDFSKYSHAMYFGVNNDGGTITDVEVGWCEVRNFRNQASGIYVHPKDTDPANGYSDNIDIHDNLIHDLGAGGVILISRNKHIRYWNNIIYNCGSQVNGRSAVDFRSSDFPGCNIEFYNNTVYSGVSQNLLNLYGADSGAAAIHLKNNIFWAFGGSPYYLGTNAVSDDDLWYGYGTPPSWAAHALNSDPQFLNVASSNFHLQATSPARDAGSAVVGSIVAKDHDGLPRPQGSGYEIGAYELVDDSQPPSNQAPSVSAGSDQTITLPANATLNGMVTDDGLPSNTLMIVWSKRSGPGTVIFTNAATANTRASFSTAGVYVLQLAADDGELTSNDTVQISVSAAAAVDLSSNLAGWWTFDEGNGATAYDSSGNGRDAALTGAAWSTGRLAGSVSFGGAGQFAQLPAAVGQTLSNFTWAGWVNWQGGIDWQRLFDFNDGSSATATNGRYMFLSPGTSSGKMRFSISQAGYGVNEWLDSSTALPSNVWVHVAVTLEGNTLSLYRDGWFETNRTVTLSPATLSLTNNYLARSAYTEDPYFSGRLDDVRVYSRALTAAEIQTLSQGGGDTDGDGLPDSWEALYFGGATNANSAADNDLDGFGNLEEYLAGTDPTDGNSRLRMVSGEGAGASGFVVRWRSASNRAYTILRTTNLLMNGDGFAQLGADIPATPPENVYTDATAGADERFYRVGVCTP
ncbi:MAG: LamG-like jellyroll fold domain-containing protein [bacterium]